MDDHHNCSHGHHHHHHEHDEAIENQPMDAASKSLSDALRLSFRILSVIMVFVLIGFMVSGVSFVEPQKVGVIKVFGKITGTSPEHGGLTYTWPYPVGDIELVRVNEQAMDVMDFWVAESGEDALKPMSDRRSVGEGLRPGLDGALFTGDRNLLHAKFACRYRIANPVVYLSQVAQVNPLLASGEEKDRALEEMIRSVICNTAIKIAAAQTADSIKNNKGRFEIDVTRAAQQELNGLLNPDGRDADAVKIINISAIVDWPIRAQAAYREAQQAKTDYDAKRSEAVKTANTTLNTVAGPGYTQLVRVPWQAPRAAAPGEDYDLIGQYTLTRQNLSKAEESHNDKLAAQYRQQAEAVLARIDNLLESSQIQGQASGVIAEANNYRANYIEGVKSRVKRFTELLAQYEKAPELMLERHWADARDEILQSKLVEKLYVTFDSNGKTVVQIKRDPKIAKSIDRALMEADKDKSDKK